MLLVKKRLYRNKYKMFFQKYGIYCGVVASCVLAGKYFYSRADADALLWLLAPTACLVSGLFGISAFEYQPQAGFVNHQLRFIIAPSCSGFQFWLVLSAVLGLSFLNRFQKKWSWLAFSTAGSYVMTLLVNSLRIVLSIRLPELLADTRIVTEFLPPEKLHSLIGIGVYFSGLLLIYRLTDCLLSPAFSESLFSVRVSSFMPPFIGYLAIVLGLPFLNGARLLLTEILFHRKTGKTGKGLFPLKDSGTFGAYALLILVTCLCLTAFFLLSSALWQSLKKQWTKKRFSA